MKSTGLHKILSYNIFNRHRFIVFLLLLSLFGCTYAGDKSENVRAPAVAGRFYPGSASELTIAVDDFLGRVPDQKIKGKLIALVSPHAGYVYSGQTAAYSFQLLKDKNIDTVILIGNSHNTLLDKGAVYTKGSFKTPLGNVPIDEKLAASLINKTDLLEKNTYPHKPEHSLEVELPFLQRTLKEFKFVPILLSGNFSMDECKRLGNAISEVLNELKLANKTILVCSTDMSHYPAWANANMCDGKALKAIEKFDPVYLKNVISDIMALRISNLACVFCGEEALYTTMYAAKNLGADTVKVLNYSNSGDISGDKSRVVGYGAIALLNSKEKNSVLGSSTRKKEGNVDEFKISEKNQKELLKIARESIKQYLTTRKLPKFDTKDPELSTPRAVFVTLNKNKRLRGCIGTTEPQAPLCEAVSQMAIAAAVQDYRFPKVTLDELDDIHIEISILSPMTRTKNPDDIIPHKHGVVVRSGMSRGGLFLPQVWEHFENKEDFMGELCSQKAGLSRNAWKDPATQLYIFTVFAFEE
ncbi:MAG: AmmeMemoRadiSam system protein B [Endomicrobiales bacterium]|nr:AmmeMemoRadiSam system protein B [Endomicrobiales bacterium]